MAKYEILIAGRTEPEAHRKNKGDILAVRAHPWNWGKVEIGIGVVVIVESSKTLEQMQDYECNIYEHKTTKVQLPYCQVAKMAEAEHDEYKVKKKCAFNLDIVELKKTMADFDDAKAANFGIKYQSFKKASQLIQKFDGKGSNRLVNDADVDTICSSAGKETECVIDFNDNASLIKDNF